jgi:hypothetical protein
VIAEVYPDPRAWSAHAAGAERVVGCLEFRRQSRCVPKVARGDWFVARLLEMPAPSR